ncbi:MAG: type I-U CRISPR-associated protein Csb2, partial [Bacteroidota bacterium]
MLCLHFDFVAGHYHATAWGHQVNEATVEWPPSPWRILRALVSAWYRLDRPSTMESAMSMVGKLASCDPVYDLPPFCEAHTRHYMPTR